METTLQNQCTDLSPVDELIEQIWNHYDSDVVEKLNNEAITLYTKLTKTERLKVMIKLFDRNVQPVLVGTEKTEWDLWYMIACASEGDPTDGCFISDLYNLAGIDYENKNGVPVF